MERLRVVFVVKIMIKKKKMNSKNKIDEKIIMYAAEVVTISQQHIATAASGY